MGAGRKLADKLKADLAAVVLGPDNEATRHAGGEAFCYDADIVYMVADDLLTDFRNESYTKALTDVVNAYKPEILLLGTTTLGRDLAGSVATTLLTGLTADCTELDVDAEGVPGALLRDERQGAGRGDGRRLHRMRHLPRDLRGKRRH